MSFLVIPILPTTVFDSIWVSTDHDEIARISEEWGAKVFRRSGETARDQATSLEAVHEFLRIHPGRWRRVLTLTTRALVLPSKRLFHELINQYQACLYLSEYIFHCGSKYGHEIPKLQMLLHF